MIESVSVLNRNPKQYVDTVRVVFASDVKTCKCKWCGTLFVRTYAPQKYCCDECRDNSRSHQNRVKSVNWYQRNKHRLSEEQRFGLGSGRLGSHRNHDFERESVIIQNELTRLKIRKLE